MSRASLINEGFAKGKKSRDSFQEILIVLIMIWLTDKIISIVKRRISYLPIQMSLRSS